MKKRFIHSENLKAIKKIVRELINDVEKLETNEGLIWAAKQIPFDLNSFLLGFDLELERRSRTLGTVDIRNIFKVKYEIIEIMRKKVRMNRKILIVSDYYEEVNENRIPEAKFVSQDIRNEFINQGYLHIDISFINKPRAGNAIKVNPTDNSIFIDVYNANTAVEGWGSETLMKLYHQDIHVLASFTITKALISEIRSDAKIIHLGHVENHAYEKGVPLAIEYCKRDYEYIGWFKGLTDYDGNLMRLNLFSTFKHLIPSILVTTCLSKDNIIPEEGIEKIKVYPIDQEVLSDRQPDNLEKDCPEIRLITSQIPACAHDTNRLIERLYTDNRRSLDLSIIAHPKDSNIRELADKLSIPVNSFGNIKDKISKNDVFIGSGTQLLVELMMAGNHVIILEELGGWPMVPLACLDFVDHLRDKKLDIDAYYVKKLPKTQEELDNLFCKCRKKHIGQAEQYQKVLSNFKSKLRNGRKHHIEVFKALASRKDEAQQ